MSWRWGFVRTRDDVSVSLMIAPFAREICSASVARLPAVFASEPRSRPEPSLNLVREAYGRTPAETRVLSAILRGQRTCEYAAASDVSQNTVQTQIKALYAKTGCHSQADLVRKTLNDPLLRLSENLGK
jgi:DNA-binding NarL/FixJ family response regulator